MSDKLSLIVRLGDSSQRAKAARLLAGQFDAEDLTIFIPDAETGVPIPAVGFPQTLPDGRLWRSFIGKCQEQTIASDQLRYPGFDKKINVTGVFAQGPVLVLLGGTPSIKEDDELLVLMPLIVSSCHGESIAQTAQAHAALAREKAENARALAESLDHARRDLGQALLEAREAQKALKQADIRKDEFLAILAHELRNPLAPISNALQLLKLSESNPGVVANVRTVIETQVSHMVRLIDDLMDVSRITTRKIILRKEPVELADIVRQALDSVAPLLEENCHTLNVHLPSEAVWLEADSTRLTQVFINLLNNAAKYTDTGGHISIMATLESDGREIVISISDNGIGIAASMLETIFETFSQVDSSLERTRGGLGVGLTLVKNLVEMHGGSVTANSDGVGCGSTFLLRLPTCLNYKATVQASRVIHEPYPGGVKSHRILIVDDNRESADTLGWLLRELGHQVELTYDSATAIEKARRYHPNIIFLDIGLPDINGYRVCQLMRDDSAIADAVYVAQTGWGQDKDRQRAFAAGFDHHLVKPIDMVVLKELLDRV